MQPVYMARSEGPSRWWRAPRDQTGAEWTAKGCTSRPRTSSIRSPAGTPQSVYMGFPHTPKPTGKRGAYG